jgi:C-terminal processing protease CtpA/Prc
VPVESGVAPDATRAPSDAPRVVAVAPDSVADRVGLRVGDRLQSVNGTVPRDVLEYHQLTDEPEVALVVDRDGITLDIDIDKAPGNRWASRCTPRCSTP